MAMTNDNPKAAIEALLFAAGEPLSVKRIATALGAEDPKAVRQMLNELKQEYDDQGRGFALEEIAGGFQLLSRPQYAECVAKLEQSREQTKFSQAALETLAIIAYKQPVGRAEIENVRGVQAGPLLRALLEKRLIRIVGRQDVPGRPFLYGTTKQFLERMGLKALSDLPRIEDLQRETKE
jgi:segregation and condensation protein B